MLALISDIHGNIAALEAVLARLDDLEVKAVVCLGDTAGYYPDVDACVARLVERGIGSVRGNHDHYLVTDTRSGRSAYADLCIDQQLSQVSEATKAWLAGLPLHATHAEIAMVHGGWDDPLDQYLTDPRDSDFADQPGRYFASGHTHLPLLWSGARAVYCNPGSVGQPRDGDPRAAFALFDGERFRIERVVYDIVRTERATLAAGLPDAVAANLVRGQPIGR